YFKDVKPLASYRNWAQQAEFPRDQYTQHLCFREGWMWFIPLVSWQGTPAANLDGALDRLLRAGRNAPGREDLVSEMGCPANEIVSIGITLRADRDLRLAEDARGAFEHYRKKYPAID